MAPLARLRVLCPLISCLQRGRRGRSRYSPVPLAKGRDARQTLVTGWVILCVGRPGVRDGCSLFLLIALLGCFLLCLGQLVLLPVDQQ